MKEIGGYLEYEAYFGKMLHENAILLNSGRGCLEYIIRARKLKKIVLPYFMCDSVFNVLKKLGIELRYYHIDERLRPKEVNIEDDEWLYLMNFYGQLTIEELNCLKKKYGRVILDMTHDYFQLPIEGMDTLYTCRKFFGVTDGAILYTEANIINDLEIDESFDRIRFLAGRYERTAAEFYQDAVKNNEYFDDAPIRKMSRFTMNILKSLDYDRIKESRTKNYAVLHELLKEKNKLEIRLVDGAFAYPFLVENGNLLRKYLIERKIYIATLWPNVLSLPQNFCEYYYAKNILPIPCDQRYTEEDMRYIAEVINNLT